ARELFRGENPLGRLVRIGGARFRVEGVMEKRGRQQGFDVDELVYLPEPVARRLFNLKGESRVLIGLNALEEDDKAARSVLAVLPCAAIGVLAGAIPAARAAGLDPVAALRASGGGKK